MGPFSETTFLWGRAIDAINEAINTRVYYLDREQIRGEAMAAHLSVRQAPTPSGVVQHGEIVCPMLRNPERRITVDLEDFRIDLVGEPGTIDSDADTIVFTDDCTLAERRSRHCAG